MSNTLDVRGGRKARLGYTGFAVCVGVFAFMAAMIGVALVVLPAVRPPAVLDAPAAPPADRPGAQPLEA